MTKVYVKTDTNTVITEINSDVFLSDVDGYTLIDEGNGDKYAHAQGNYLESGLIDERGRYNYKLRDGNVTELTEAEKDILFPDDTKKPNTEERISVMEDAVQELILMQLGMGGGE